MFQRSDSILMDTNAIIEAHRTRCWKALAGHFRLETVDKCLEESSTGQRRRPGYVVVEPEELKKTAVIHKVSLPAFVKAQARASNFQRLDDGERELLAHALERTDSWCICSPDGNAIRVGHDLGFLDRFASLEKLALAVGLKPDFKEHFTEKWLARFRTDLRLNNP